MPGAMSDQDRNFLVSMVPGLGRSREGNALMVRVAEDQRAYNTAMAQEQLRFLEQNRSQTGMERHMAEWRERYKQENGGGIISPTTRQAAQAYRQGPGRNIATTEAQEGALAAANDNFSKKPPDQQAQIIARLRELVEKGDIEAITEFNARYSRPGSGLAESLAAEQLRSLTPEKRQALEAAQAAARPALQPRGAPTEQDLGGSAPPEYPQFQKELGAWLAKWMKGGMNVSPPAQPQPPRQPGT